MSVIYRKSNVFLLKFTTAILLIAFLFAGCDKAIDNPDIEVDDSFESGSIGNFEKLSANVWDFYIADDNGNEELPDSWRSWYYFKVKNISRREISTLTIKNSGWPYYYIPVFSYDQKQWLSFNEEEITQNTNNDIIINKIFDKREVYIARFFPYTLTDLENYIDEIKGRNNLEITTPGLTQEGRPIYLLKISDNNKPVENKTRIFIHARTHAAETPPSFVIEGLVDYLTEGNSEANEILSKFEFYIFPMQNADGVVAGNYRATPKSENLEMLWDYDLNNTLELKEGMPPEVTVIHQLAKKLMTEGGPAVSIALNLHASNSEPETRPFFFPHFGREDKGYKADEVSLWNKQLRFIGAVSDNYGNDLIEPITEDGGSSFATKTYPESWWWVNFKDSVMAMTFEMTYSKAGYNHWVTADDYRFLGRELASAIWDYSDQTFNPTAVALKSGFTLSDLKYPELYPPIAKDELKE